jgi:hypothetical protein
MLVSFRPISNANESASDAPSAQGCRDDAAASSVRVSLELARASATGGGCDRQDKAQEALVLEDPFLQNLVLTDMAPAARLLLP